MVWIYRYIVTAQYLNPHMTNFIASKTVNMGIFSTSCIHPISHEHGMPQIDSSLWKHFSGYFSKSDEWAECPEVEWVTLHAEWGKLLKYLLNFLLLPQFSLFIHFSSKHTFYISTYKTLGDRIYGLWVLSWSLSVTSRLNHY